MIKRLGKWICDSGLNMFNTNKRYKSFLLLRKENESESKNTYLAVSTASMVCDLFYSLACLWVKMASGLGGLPCRGTTILVTPCAAATELTRGCYWRAMYCKKHKCRSLCKILWKCRQQGSNSTCEETGAQAEGLKCPASVHSAKDLGLFLKLTKMPCRTWNRKRVRSELSFRKITWATIQKIN